MIRSIGIASLWGVSLYTFMTPVLAQNTPTWRCGNAYSDRPCHGGKAVDVSDPRSAGDRRAADAVTQRAAQSADTMERERLQLEHAATQREHANALANARAKTERDRAARLAAAPRPSKKHKTGRLPPDYFTARGESAPEKKPAKVSRP